MLGRMLTFLKNACVEASHIQRAISFQMGVKQCLLVGIRSHITAYRLYLAGGLLQLLTLYTSGAHPGFLSQTPHVLELSCQEQSKQTRLASPSAFMSAACGWGATQHVLQTVQPCLTRLARALTVIAV